MRTTPDPATVAALVKVMGCIETLDWVLAHDAYPNTILQASEALQRAITDYAETRMETVRKAA